MFFKIKKDDKCFIYLSILYTKVSLSIPTEHLYRTLYRIFWHLSLSLSLSLSLTYSGRTGVFAGDMEEHTVLSGDDVGHTVSVVGDRSEPTPS